MPPPPLALEARDLVKTFGDLTAVGGVSLSIPRGTCLALLGPNGAGKTTTIEMLEGITTPDSGTIELLGRRWHTDAAALRERIGVQLQETKLTEKVTVDETLRLFRSFYDAPRPADELLELVGLTEKRSARVQTLSGGQHQRLALACALVQSPELLFLDEPSTGLDPQSRRRVWEIVDEFKQRGGTVLLTTHYMEEAARLADQVVIVDAGKIIAQGTPASLIESLHADSIVELFPTEADLAKVDISALGALPEISEARKEGAAIHLTVTNTQAAVAGILGWLEDADVRLESLQTHAPTLEDVFVALTGKQLRDA